ncbi:MAG: recombinase family protein [Clostridia bacterium]|nr:recombinase family protein [Clostridia bacterium]
MINRKHPYGYTVIGGRILADPDEAAIVSEIFTAYASGASYRQLVDRLNGRGVAYDKTGRSWNKNMIARVLDCPVYTGSDRYPAIISRELQHAARVARPQTGKSVADSSLSKEIRCLMRCSTCEGALESVNKGEKKRWFCPACASRSTAPSTGQIQATVGEILTRLTENPDLVQTKDRAGETALEESPLPEFLESPDFAPETAREMALAHAAAQFAALNMSDYETERIRHLIIQNENTSTEPDKLLNKIAAAILIHPTGTVSLKLQNGQIIESQGL